MSNSYSSAILSVLPRQRISRKKKTKQWREDSVNAVAGFGGQYHNTTGRSSAENKKANYDIVASILNEDDLRYVLDPYGQGTSAINTQPSRMRDINIIVNKLNKLKGEEISRPFNPTIMAVNGEAISEKEKQKRDLLLRVAQAKIAEELGVPQTNMVNPSTGEEELPQSFEDVEKYSRRTMKDIREEWANHVYNYINLEQNLVSKFNLGWEHGLISAEEIYYVGIVNGEVNVRVVNPLNCDFDRNPDNNNIEDGDWFREDRHMTIGQILDEYGEYLTEAQVDMLDKKDFRPNANNTMYPGFAYDAADISRKDRTNYSYWRNNTDILVTHVCWKSMKKIGFVSYPDENDEIQTGIVDESFKITPEMEAMGYKIEWEWIPDWWHGTKIGDEFYVNIEPIPNQTRSMDNPHKVPGPYVGRVYNSTNTKQTSLVDLIKPHQYLYNIVWFRLETELAKAKGKKMIMDIAQIPKSHGIDMDKWMYYFDNLGIAFINSFEEGTGQFQGTTGSSQFNQFTAVDMSLSNAISQYVLILNKIEMVVDRMIGINAQREGDIQQRETATGIDQAITMSSHITEPYFFVHNEVKKEVVSRCIETAKYAYPGSKKINYILGDTERIHMTLDTDKFSDSDYGVFVSDSTKDHHTFMKLESLAGQAIASGAAAFSDMINVYKATSVSELSNAIKDAEFRRQQQEAEQQKMVQDMEQQKLMAEAKEKEEARIFEAEQKQLDRENEIRKTVINTMGFDEDIQGNAVNDIVSQGELYLKELESERRNEVDNKKIETDRSLKEQELQVKNKEIESKERIEKLKARTALKNKVAGEK
jgi:hypothetical protein